MRSTRALLLIATACGPIATLAQSPTDPPPIAIVLRPAAQPRPALKYRLVPERIELEPGNAALFYHRAILMTKEKYRSLADQETPINAPRSEAASREDPVNKWINVPIAEIPRDQAIKMIESFAPALEEVELGASRSSCDWEFDRRKDGYNLLIPEIQESRSLARLVSLKIRLAILDGRIDEALHWIEVGMVLGRHVAQGPTLIQSLVGVAINFTTFKCVEELIQAPGTPSLYWALADRPRPFIDLRPAMEGERHVLEKEIPALRELDGEPWSVAKARKFTDEMQGKLAPLAGIGPPPGSDPGGMVAARRLGMAAMAAKAYPEARRALLAEGRPEAEIDAMAVIQVATLFSYREFERIEEDSLKWVNVPYWQAHDHFDRAGIDSMEKKLANPLLAMFRATSPNIKGVRLASLRIDRQLDALQCIEAIRLHAEAHGGKLPATLESITEAPVPIDVATGKPFAYAVDGDSATLSAPIPPGAPNVPSFAIRYALKLVN